MASSYKTLKTIILGMILKLITFYTKRVTYLYFKRNRDAVKLKHFS